MADENIQQTQQGDGAATEPDWKAMYEQAAADAEKWKAMSRKNEAKAKGNADAAEQLADLSERLAAIEAENGALKAQAARTELVSKVAASTGVPEAIVASLAANDEDALTRAATAIADSFKPKGGAPKAPEAGRFPQEGAEHDDIHELARQLFNRN